MTPTLLKQLDKAMNLPAPQFAAKLEKLVAKLHRKSNDDIIRTRFCVRLVDYIETLPPDELSLVSYASLLVGTTLERGADPEPLLPLFVEILQRTIQFIDQHLDYAVQSKRTLGQSDFEQSEEELDEHVESLHNLMSQLELATAALLSRSRNARDIAKTHESLITTSIGLRWHFPFLHHACVILDDEPLLVLNPEQKWGFEVKISGIADNWQLHSLLSDFCFHTIKENNGTPNWIPPAPEIVECLKGIGHQELEQLQTPGVWNLYDWTGVNSDGSLAIKDPATWIWGEGVPADIPHCPFLKDKRVLVLGPPAMDRWTEVGREFDALKAEIELVKVLSEKEVQTMVNKLAKVSDKKKQAAIKLRIQATRVDVPDLEDLTMRDEPESEF